MIGLPQALKQRAAAGEPVRVAVIGAGQMGTDIVSQISLMTGVEAIFTADIRTENALRAHELAGTPGERLVVADDIGKAADSIKKGKWVVSANGMLAPELPGVDVIIDATGSPETGARLALAAIHNKKHIVMLNVEADVTVGPILNRMAEDAGIVYTLSAGDEPGAIMELYDFATAMGVDVVCCGKGKNNPLNIDATPDDLAEKARERGMNPWMLVEFVDGSKTVIEMAAVANATGLIPDITNMHGPTTTVKELHHVFSLKSEGGILSKRGVVDYAIGDINPGVFLVFTTEQERLRSSLIQRDMGLGPNYLLFRPYHLCSMETPISAVSAVVFNRATMKPKDRLVTEVTAIAKCDLKPGDTLDGIGGYTFRCGVELREAAKAANSLPAGLAKGAVLTKAVKKGQVISYNDVNLPGGSVLLELRRLQDLTTE